MCSCDLKQKLAYYVERMGPSGKNKKKSLNNQNFWEWWELNRKRTKKWMKINGGRYDDGHQQRKEKKIQMN